MAALINRFADAEAESRYVISAREAARPLLRLLTVIAIAIMVAFTLINPMFFPAHAVIVINIVSIAMLAVLGVTWFVVGSDYYPRLRWLDPLLFTVSVAASIVTAAAFGSTEGETQTSFLGVAVITLAILFVFSSVSFVANTRWYLIWASGLMLAYVLFLAVQPIALFPRIYMAANVGMFFVFAIFVNWSLDARARQVFEANEALEAAKVKTEELLFNVLPQSVANRLRSGEAVADSFSDLTVIFADIVGFSELAKQVSPGHLVKLLNQFFSLADQAAARHGIEKVKTIGDAYLAVSGGTASAGSGADEAVEFGRALIAAMESLAAENRMPIQLRIGIHTGPVVGGVVGSSRLAYDYWGDTMNIASRIEGAAQPGGIAVSSSTFLQCSDRSIFGESEAVVLKGVGEVQIYRTGSSS